MYVRTVGERFFNRTYANVLRELDHTGRGVYSTVQYRPLNESPFLQNPGFNQLLSVIVHLTLASEAQNPTSAL